MNPEATFADAEARFAAHKPECLQCQAFPLARPTAGANKTRKPLGLNTHLIF